MWPTLATPAADLRPTHSLVARKLRQSFVRTLQPFVLQTTCRGAKVEDFRTRCNQWTRTQRIRTAAAIPITAVILDAGSTPVYVEIGEKAAHLRELGMSDRAIGAALGVSDKTIAKSLRHGPKPRPGGR